MFRTEEPEEAGDPWLGPLLAVRTRMLVLLEDRSQPLRRRLAMVLALARDSQLLLDEDRGDALGSLAAAWQCRIPAAEGSGLFPQGFRFLAGLEVLEPDWPDLLRRAEETESYWDEALLERIAAYFLFRHGLKAVNDGDLLSRIALAVFAVAAAARLAPLCGLAEALGRFSREIEHDEENLRSFREAFWQREELSLDRYWEELSN